MLAYNLSKSPMVKICKIHGFEYKYVCSECLQPFLSNTRFSSLEEVRGYQIHYARKVKYEDKGNNIKCIGIIKLKVLKEIACIGAYFYDLNKQKLKNSLFKVYKTRFSEYFPSVLFLNQSEIYVKFLNSFDKSPDCYILNSSGQIHPYLYGTACDVGLHLEVPVIGYTKKLLYGQIKSPIKKGDIPGVYTNDLLIGYAVPKLKFSKYLYVSVGNNITLQKALITFLKIDFQIFSRLSIELNNYIQPFQDKIKTYI